MSVLASSRSPQGVGEEVLGERGLGRSAQAPAAMLRQQHDPDVERPRGAGRPVLHGKPPHGSDGRAVLVLDHQVAVVVTDHPVGGEASLELVRGGEPVEQERIVLDGTVQLGHVVSSHRP